MPIVAPPVKHPYGNEEPDLNVDRLCELHVRRDGAGDGGRVWAVYERAGGVRESPLRGVIRDPVAATRGRACPR